MSHIRPAQARPGSVSDSSESSSDLVGRDDTNEGADPPFEVAVSSSIAHVKNSGSGKRVECGLSRTCVPIYHLFILNTYTRISPSLTFYFRDVCNILVTFLDAADNFGRLSRAIVFRRRLPIKLPSGWGLSCQLYASRPNNNRACRAHHSGKSR